MKIKMFFILALVCLIMFSSISYTFAINPDDYKTEPKFDTSSSAMTIAKNVIGIINGIGITVLVATVGILGIKYMSGSAEERADYKRTMIPILIGAILLFGLSTIINLVYNVMNS